MNLGAGTINSDSLCMDATDDKIVVAGYNSQKVMKRNRSHKVIKLNSIMFFICQIEAFRRAVYLLGTENKNNSGS